MNTRIRYRKTQDENILRSVRSFTHENNGARYYVLLNKSEQKWEIVDEGNDLVATSGFMSHPHAMKIEVKKALKDLGINFNAEERAKTETTLQQ